jgi:alkylation response protein AidB-like acyl-CoA dehydrogenase
VSFGLIADVFLVIGQTDDKPTAVLVKRDTDGLIIRPTGKGLLGLRGAMVADVDLRACRVRSQDLLANVGQGFIPVAMTALDHGRYSVAWGCVGLAESCLAYAANYARARHQFSRPLSGHQLIRRLLTDMVVETRAARLVCAAAGEARDKRRPSAPLETMAAKYLAARVALNSADSAVQIHGANGCSDQYPVERYWRDARVMRLIEGTDEINQLAICELALTNHKQAKSPVLVTCEA